MKFKLGLYQIILTSFCWPIISAYAVDLKLNNTTAMVCFSPQDQCSEAIVKEITRAKAKILIQAYTFNSSEVVAALLQAHARGVAIEIILDKSNLWAKSSAGFTVSQAGIPTYIDSCHVIANNKVMIIDDNTVSTGSFNFTETAASKNAENLLIIRNRELAAVYLDNWAKHKEHAVRYDSRQDEKSR
ncbi:MAG: phospholipase D family protein [Syntrophales bacterium]